MLQHVIDWERAASSRPAAITPAHHAKSNDASENQKLAAAKPLADIINSPKKPKRN